METKGNFVLLAKVGGYERWIAEVKLGDALWFVYMDVSANKIVDMAWELCDTIAQPASKSTAGPSISAGGEAASKKPV